MPDETWTDAEPDRMPTPAEEAAADAAAEHVDVAAVKAHEDEMNELGADVEGEGQVELEAD
ncbi:MAG: hypothetical protein ABIR68_05100, partial [Ilumatobacteraceae bacterium]